MEELKQFQGFTFDAISRRKLVEDRDGVLELTGKIQELQNEVNCTTREILKMLNQYAVDYPTFPVKPELFPLYRDPWRNAKPFSGNAEPQR